MLSGCSLVLPSFWIKSFLLCDGCLGGICSVVDALIWPPRFTLLAR